MKSLLDEYSKPSPSTFYQMDSDEELEDFEGIIEDDEEDILKEIYEEKQNKAIDSIFGIPLEEFDDLEPDFYEDLDDEKEDISF